MKVIQSCKTVYFYNCSGKYVSVKLAFCINKFQSHIEQCVHDTSSCYWILYLFNIISERFTNAVSPGAFFAKGKKRKDSKTIVTISRKKS